MMRVTVVLLLLLSGSGRVFGQANEADIPLPKDVHGLLAYDSIIFDFVPRAPDVPAWTIRLNRNLTGIYREKTDTAVPANITVSAGLMTQLSGADESVNAKRCETKAKNIAQTGQKTVTYALGPLLATCSFNYSDDEILNTVAKAFQAIAETMRLGAKLAHDRRFDHLGLNADLDTLTLEAKDKRAIELQNIAPILRSIVDNDDLMGVVRRKAQSLLQDASLQPASM